MRKYGESSNPGRGARWGRRVLWYSVATVLLLALPTFSDLRPRVTVQIDRLMDGVGLPRTNSTNRPEGEVPGAVSGTSAGFSSRNRQGLAGGSAGRGSGGGTGPVGLLDQTSGHTQFVTMAAIPEGSSRYQGRPGGVSNPAEMTEMLGELSRLEQEVRAVASSLFPTADGFSRGFAGGGLLGNPFAEALGGGGGSSTEGPPTGGSDSGNGNPDTPTGGGGGPVTPPPDPPNNPPSGGDGGSDVPEPEPELVSVFLVLAPVGPEEGGASALLATRDTGGRFVLENGATLDLFPGLVGPGRAVLLAEEGQQLMTADVLSDGILEVFSTQEAYLGTAVYGHRLISGAFREWAYGFFLYDRVLGLATFDFDGDGREELVAITAASPNLQIFRLDQGELRYLRELTLPIQPGLLATSRDPVRSGQSVLQVFDRNLRNWVVFDSRYPGVYSFARPGGFVSAQDVTVPFAAGGFPRQFRILRYWDRLVVAELVGDGFRHLGSFDLARRSPTVVIGDHRASGSQQVLLVP